MQSREVRERQPAAITLIGQRRIGEPVAYHPDAPVERRLDQPDNVVAARRVQQQRLADRVPALGRAVEQQAADRAECQKWATDQAGQVAQNGSDYNRAMVACVEGRGYSAR